MRVADGFSITRLEGSRWCLRRTRQAMEKVGECGLMWSRDEGAARAENRRRRRMREDRIVRCWRVAASDVQPRL